LVVLVAAGCSQGASGSAPTWVPQQNFQENRDPQPRMPNSGAGIPEPQPSMSGRPAPQPNPGAPGGTSSPGKPSTSTDPNVVATKLNQPTGLVVLPDGTALVGERTTGRILRVQPEPGKPVSLVQTLVGVDGSGDGGLLDLAISPTYVQDGLIYAYLTATSDNRVVHFAVGSAPSPIVVGIPKAKTGNAGRLAFDAKGALLIGTGDAGKPAAAAAKSSLAGKILRTDDLGRALPDNPTPGSVIIARGLRSVDGLCVDPATGLRFAISAGHPDEVNLIKPRADYGWPHATKGTLGPVITLPKSTTGGAGCAMVRDQLVVATSTGKSLLAAKVSKDGKLSPFAVALKGRYGRLRSVVLGSDGALWLTTSNRDGHGKPVPDDDRVLRITTPEGGGKSVV
jgi:glucose/arabinose dehydrogenase